MLALGASEREFLCYALEVCAKEIKRKSRKTKKNQVKMDDEKGMKSVKLPTFDGEIKKFQLWWV